MWSDDHGGVAFKGGGISRAGDMAQLRFIPEYVNMSILDTILHVCISHGMMKHNGVRL